MYTIRTPLVVPGMLVAGCIAPALLIFSPAHAKGAVSRESAPASASQPGALSGRAAIDRVAGNTLVLNDPNRPANSEPLVLYLAADNTVVTHDGMDGSQPKRGRWWASDSGELCMLEDGGQKTDDDCASVIVKGDQVEIWLNNEQLADMRIAPGNAYNL